jgi:hypothetical protein
MNVLSAKDILDDEGNPMTPFAYCMGQRPSIHNFQDFGCPIFFKRYRSKSETERASRGIFIGFMDNQAGWLIFNPELAQHIVISANGYFDESFEITLVFDSKPFQGVVPTHSPPDSSDPCLYPNLLDPLEWTGAADQIGTPSSSFHVDIDLAKEGNEEEGNDDGDQLQEGHEDEAKTDAETNQNSKENDDHTGDDMELPSHDQEEDYGIIAPPFPEQYVRCSL